MLYKIKNRSRPMSKISVISILAKNLEEACHKVNEFKKEVISVVIEDGVYKFVVKNEENKTSKSMNDDYRYLATSPVEQTKLKEKIVSLLIGATEIGCFKTDYPLKFNITKDTIAQTSNQNLKNHVKYKEYNTLARALSKAKILFTLQELEELVTESGYEVFLFPDKISSYESGDSYVPYELIKKA